MATTRKLFLGMTQGKLIELAIYAKKTKKEKMSKKRNYNEQLGSSNQPVFLISIYSLSSSL